MAYDIDTSAALNSILQDGIKSYAVCGEPPVFEHSGGDEYTTKRVPSRPLHQYDKIERDRCLTFNLANMTEHSEANGIRLIRCDNGYSDGPTGSRTQVANTVEVVTETDAKIERHQTAPASSTEASTTPKWK